MKCDDKEKWYMTSRWENCKCNNEEYSWDDDFIWGNKCDYNDDFKWECKECDKKCQVNDNKVEKIGVVEDNIDIQKIEDIKDMEEIPDTEDDDDEEDDNDEDDDDEYDDCEEDDEDDNEKYEDIEEQVDINMNSIKDIDNLTTAEKQEENIHLKDDTEEYIEPMKYVLKQLMNMDANDLEIGSERQGTLLNCRIVGIDKTLIKIQTDHNFVLIPIREIIGIYSRRMKEVILIQSQENNLSKTHDEQELMQYIVNKVGKSIRINTSSNDELFRSVYGTVSKVGEGIVMLSNKMIIQINKIIYVEEDFQ